MRLRAVLREVGRDIASGTARFGTFGALLALVVGALVLTDAATVAQQVSAAETFRSAGAATEVLTAEGRVDPAACDALADVPGVAAAGALRSAGGKVRISALPDAPVPAYDVSPGFARVLGSEDAGRSGVLLARELADALGASAGDTVATERGAVPIASVFDYPADGRRPGFGYAVLSVMSDRGPFDECWTSAWPQLTNLRGLLLTTLAPGGGGGDERPQVAQLNASLGSTFTGNAAFLSRPTGLATPAAAAIGAALGFLSVRLRRLQLASALHAGIARTDVLAIHLLETASWAIAATAIGLGTAAATTQLVPGADQRALLLTVAGIPLAAAAGVLVGAAAAGLTASERQLFRYFKDR